MMENYSLSDIKAVTGGNENGFGGNGFWIIVLVILAFPMIMPMMTQMWGGGNNGLFSNGGATAAAQQEILYGQQFQNIHNKLNSIGQGMCDSTFALNNTITSEGRALQNQIAECCCDNRVAIANLNAKIDQQTGVITNMFKDSKIDMLQSQVADLRLKDAMCGVIRYPTQTSYCTSCNPFFGNTCGGYQPNI